MYLGAAASLKLARELRPLVSKLKKSEVWVAPSFPYLSAVAEAVGASTLKVGAQNVCWESEGAFTGEVSSASLKEAGCTFSIVGHSERRALCSETPELVANRAKFALKDGLMVIVCCGETAEQRKSGTTNETLDWQLTPVIKSISRDLLPNLIVAYEPVWAIGTGAYPTSGEIVSAHAHLAKRFSDAFNAAPPILYGGSVSPDNALQIFQAQFVDGALIGRASLNVEQFNSLIKAAESA
jgi:triosephosphate isomerase